MTGILRPTVHQLLVTDWTCCAPADLVALLAAAVDHVAGMLTADDAASLREQVAPGRALALRPRDVRYPLVRSHGPHRGLYPVLGHESLRAALLAYQDGAGLLIHFIWHWDGLGDAETVRALGQSLWTAAPSQMADSLDEALLVTAALDGGSPADRSAQAEALLAALPARYRPEAALAPASLGGGALYAPAWGTLQAAPWPSALLFHDSAVEESREADRLTTVIWPLVAQFRLRLDRLYRDYREQRAPKLESCTQAMQRAEADVFAPAPGSADGIPRILSTGSPRRLQAALSQLAGPQFALMDAASAAGQQLDAVRRELANLERAAEQMAGAPLGGEDVGSLDAAPTVDLIAGLGRRFVAQVAADADRVHSETERASRGVDVLRTQADILDARYQMRLNWVIGVVGAVLALAQIVDNDVARVVYEELGGGAWWVRLGGLPLGQGHDELVLFLVRMAVIGLAAAAAGALVWLGTLLVKLLRR